MLPARPLTDVRRETDADSVPSITTDARHKIAACALFVSTARISVGLSPIIQRSRVDTMCL
jgi:hypothetical protein